jgi:hypothetical protein
MKDLLKIVLAGLFSAVLFSGCGNYAPSSDEIQRKAQEALAKQGAMSVGMPSIVNFQEKRTLKDIYELRDKAIMTYTYITDMNGHLHKICDSIGYGISGATQFTSPQQDAYYTTVSPVHMAMPQADPNGLFSPASDEGTWVMCKNPNGKEVMPIRMEPRTIISPFPLKSVD